MDRPEPPAPDIDPELLENAARIGLAVDGMSERDLRLRLQKLDPSGAEARARRWAEDNAEAIKEHNDRIERRGLIGDHFRKW